jgi:hypothetical protein
MRVSFVFKSTVSVAGCRKNELSSISFVNKGSEAATTLMVVRPLEHLFFELRTNGK